MRVVVRGVGDVGSAISHRLFNAGYAVALHDSPLPPTTRRKMAFADAVFDGQAILDGVTAVRLDELAGLPALLTAHTMIPIVVCDVATLLAVLQPDVLVDARLRKRVQPERQRGLVPLTIGIGPNFSAGETVDLAIETSWGEELGRILRQGTTRRLAGEPRPIAGYGRERYVYSPVAGVCRTQHQIGDVVRQGEVITLIDACPLPAPINGVLRGLTRDGVSVGVGTKVIEVDPRSPGEVMVSGIGERPARIATSVLAVVDEYSLSRGTDEGRDSDSGQP